MLYYKIPVSGGFESPAGCILRRAFLDGAYMWCAFESITEVGSGWVSTTESQFKALCPTVSDIPTPPHQELIATAATLSGGNINLSLPGTVDTGTVVKFEAPCTCAQVTGGLLIDGEVYTVVDAMGNCVTGIGGVWTSGAQLAVVIDTTNKKAFLQTIPVKDAYSNAVYATILADGWLNGCGLSYTGQKLTIAKGMLIACGNPVKLSAAREVTVSQTSGYARVSLKLSKVEASGTIHEQATFVVDYAASLTGFPALVQEDINEAGATYQTEICVLSLRSTGINDVSRRFQRASPHIWIPADQRGTSAPDTAPDGMAFFVEVG